MLAATLTLESSDCRYSEDFPLGSEVSDWRAERVHEEHVHEVMSMGTQDEYMLMDLHAKERVG